MKLNELKNLSKEELSAKLGSINEEMSKINYLRVAGQVDKPHKFKVLRKSIARINTLLKEAKLKEAKK